MISWLQEHMLPCPYKSLFGVECPGCGSQRSFVELLKGNFEESFFLYPPLVPVLFLIGFVAGKFLSNELVATKFLRTYSLIVLFIVVFNYIGKFIC